MKALFNRLNRGLSKDKEKLSSSTTDSALPVNREKLDLPPLREWPPSHQPQRVTSTPSSFHSAKPLPDIVSARPLPPIDPLPAVPVSQTSSMASTDASMRSFASSPPPQIPPSSLSAPRVSDRAGLGLGLITSTRGEAAPPPPPSSDSSSDQRSSTEQSRPQQQQHQSAALRGARKATSEQGTSVASPSSADAHNQKKVAFISPPPTPAPLQRALLDTDTPAPDATTTTIPSPPPAPMKTTVTRFQAAHGADASARGSSSTASSSKVNVVSKPINGNTAKATSTRTVLSPTSQKTLPDNASAIQSMRSTTPYSQTSQSTSRILSTASWSEAAEEDLVSNLGPRERTRQEVLWEIVASEERYVAELMKLKDTFIEPLLHPFASPPPTTSPTPMIHDDREDHFYARVDSPRESIDHLPIASRFLSPTAGLRSETPATTATSAIMTVQSSTSTNGNTPNIDGESVETDEDEAADQIGKAYARNGPGLGNQLDGVANRRKKSSALAAAVAKFNDPRSPYGASSSSSSRNGTAKGGKGALPFPSRSHQSLPPPPRLPQGSTASLGRQSIIGMPPPLDRENSFTPTGTTTDKKTSTSRVLKKIRRSVTTPEMLLPDSVPPHQLPEDLRKVLEVLENGIFDGHVILSENLRKRYEEQYPLVRSLADVFVSNSHILHEYATYVLHLERALEQVDAALSTASDSKKPKNQDAAVWLKVCKVLHGLEDVASEKGETGLAISLSKPFQRLLKYPLLFQNLLYHTDPSTFEYESTLQMVAEVETIVRSIEDEKIQKEERDKTRDAFARIDGLEKVKQLAMPKASRLLVEEKPLNPPSSTSSSPQGRPPPPSAASNKNVKGKSSFRRLSEVLHTGNGVGGKKDLWLVKFNDVELRCQRTGVTSLPLVSSTTSRTNSLPELQAKAKYATTGRKGAHTKPRNLYKFLKIENWAINNGSDLREGVISMEDVVRSRADVQSGVPTIGRTSTLPEDDEDDEDGNDSSDSDRKSKMSFSYWGADKITVHKPMVRARPANPGTKKGNMSPLGFGRESSANAKFGSRLVNQDGPHHHARPASRRTQATPSSRRAGTSEDGHSTAKSTVTTTRPAWDGSTRTVTTTPIVPKRQRNNSQTSNTVAPRASNKSLGSPAPSEDSGVGLYRQYMAQDSTLNS